MSLDNTSHPGRPGPDELVPSRYALRVGEIDVLVVSDGVCASKRMSANGRVYEPSPTRTASWQLSMRGFEGLNSSCGRFAPNQSHCAPAATK